MICKEPVTRLRPRLAFKLLFASPDFMVNGRPAPEMPLILDASGELHRGAANYFIQRIGWEGWAKGTARVEAYAIKEWLEYLQGKDIPWNQPTDNLLAAWATDQGIRKIKARRIQEKIGYVFHFYRVLQRLGFVEGLTEDSFEPEYNEDGSRRRLPLASELVVIKTYNGRGTRQVYRSAVRYGDPEEIRGRKRYTPMEHEVEAIFDDLLGKSAADEYARVRNFFCARVMAHMGLRRQGVEGMTTRALEVALAQVGIRVPAFRPTTADERGNLLATGWKPWLTGLDAIADMPIERDRILAGLTDVEKQHRRNLYITVVEKGRKSRDVPVPIRLLRAILVEWLWGQRKRFIDDRRRRHPHYVPPSELWLSRKTGMGMTAAAIANEVKLAFNRQDIDASGHRLRAFFITELVRDLYLAARAAHGRMFDARNILDQAAEIAGHENPSSLEPYLDRVMKEENVLPGEPVLVEDPDDAAVLRAMAEVLNRGDGATAASIRKMLGMLLDKFGLQAVPMSQSLSDAQDQVQKNSLR